MALQFVFVPSRWVIGMFQINTYDKLNLWLDLWQKLLWSFFKDREDE